MMGLEIRKSPIHGRGVFATRDYQPGELLGIYEGRVVTDLSNKHTLYLQDGEERWWGILGDGPLSFMNHADDPNATVSTGGPYVYALCAIAKDQEITMSYGDGWKPKEKK
jgi:SET domain-containing protein